MNPELTPTFLPENPDVGYLNHLKQGSDTWHKFRKDKITATGAYEILQGRSITSILEEKQNSEDNFAGNYFTERGHILEEEARKLYQDINSVTIKEVGVVINLKYPVYACSPDGLVGTDGGIEIKCFQEKRQEEVFQNLDPQIIAQIQFNLFITERKWWDWVLYNPEVEDLSKAYHTKRFLPDIEMFEKFRKALDEPINNPEIKETALQIINLQNQLEQQSEVVKAQIEFYNKTKAEIEFLKQRLKDETKGKVKQTIKVGENSLDISIHDNNRISVKDASLVPEEYTTTIQVDNIFQAPNGKYYQRVPQTKLVDNLVKAGKGLPPGFELKKTRSISIKFNGETL